MERGPVDIKGVTTRTNESTLRVCVACVHPVAVGRRYERVARLTGDIESYHEQCFEDEFGPRQAYGE